MKEKVCLLALHQYSFSNSETALLKARRKLEKHAATAVAYEAEDYDASMAIIQQKRMEIEKQCKQMEDLLYG